MSPLTGPLLSRRNLIATGGKGLAGIGLAAAVVQTTGCMSSAPRDPAANEVVSDPGPVILADTLDPSERKQNSPPNPLPPSHRLGYAVVGLGHLSLEEILPALRQSRCSRLAAIVSGHPSKAQAVAQQYGLSTKHIYDYTTYDRLKDDADVDVIYVVLPNGMHEEFTVRGAQAGKHILCEKPMANSSREAQNMIRACKDARRTLMIAYRLQYEPHHREVIRRARSGEYGELKLIVADNGQNLGDPHQWRLNKKLAGGGAMSDVGIYCLNAARYITGEEPTEVSARITQPSGDPRFKEVEESIAFRLQFPGGVLANCTGGYGNHEYRRLSVMGSKSWSQMDNAFTYRGLRLRCALAHGHIESISELQIPEKNHFAAEMDYFSRCIQDDAIPYTAGEEGLQDLRIIEAAYRSAAEGGKSVQITAGYQRSGREPTAD